MKIYRETCVAGRTILQTLRASTRIKSAGEKRAPKQNPTSEAVKRVNYKNAVWTLTKKLNHNFSGSDYLLTLTCKENLTPHEFYKKLNKFKRNVRNHCKRHDIEFKNISVMEYKGKRPHSHIVCSGIPLEIIEKYWQDGWVNVKLLDPSGNYQKLAEYLLKETEELFRRSDCPFKRRYSESNNITMPKTYREELTERALHKDPKPTKGYYIDKESVRRYEHAILGVECMEYIQVSDDPLPRVKRWKKGILVKRQEHFKLPDEAEQLSMGLLPY